MSPDTGLSLSLYALSFVIGGLMGLLLRGKR